MPPLKPSLEPGASELRRALDRVDPEALADAVEAAARRRIDEFVTGVLAYRRHPYRRDLVDPPAIWREGTTRLLDYGGRGEGLPVFFVTSLINRFYILDLSAERSLARYLAGKGLRPFVVDWGPPGPEERRFSLSEYIGGRLEHAFAAAVAACGAPMPVVGYCMGGLLALALALRRNEEVNGLALLATPWDFHVEATAQAAAALVSGPFAEMLDEYGELPVDALQTLFYWLDPYLSIRKFLAFSRLAPDSEEAKAFVALEDWVNDGVPLAAPVARECLAGWYGKNTPGRGRWRVAGDEVRPEKFTAPSLVIVPARDRIVPPASAAILADRLPAARVLTPPLGHIGMIVSHDAPGLVWRPLLRWLREVAKGGRPPYGRRRRSPGHAKRRPQARACKP